MSDEVRFVTCPECGNQQGDMGTRVQCEACDYGPMPSYDYPEDSQNYPRDEEAAP